MTHDSGDQRLMMGVLGGVSVARGLVEALQASETHLLRSSGSSAKAAASDAHFFAENGSPNPANSSLATW